MDINPIIYLVLFVIFGVFKEFWAIGATVILVVLVWQILDQLAGVARFGGGDTE